MRDVKRIPIILERLRRIWERNPDLRLGQLVVIGTQPAQPNAEVFNIEDEKLLDALLKYEARSAAGEQEIEISLGEGTDGLLVSKVGKVAAAAGGSVSEASWDVGGSQEVITYAISLPGGQLTLVAETYVGLLLRGPKALATEFSHAVQSA